MSGQYELVRGVWRDVWNDWACEGEQPTKTAVDSWAGMVLSDRTGWCGCSHLELFTNLSAEYLRGDWSPEPDSKLISFDLADAFQTIIAMTCDAVGFTEHGGTLRFAWLTKEGEAWLDLHANDSP